MSVKILTKSEEKKIFGGDRRKKGSSSEPVGIPIVITPPSE